MENLNKLIDLDSVIRDFNPKLYKRLPRFVIGILKRIIRQDKINRLLTLYGHLDGSDFIEAVFKDFNVDIQSYGLDNVDKNQRLMFVANHPLGGIDGLAVIYSVCKNFNHCKGIVNDLLLFIVSLRSVFCGVNVYGHNNETIFKNIESLFNDPNENVCAFPAGLVSRKINGNITDLQWKKNFIIKAIEHNLPIVPVYVDAQNSRFFYNIANLRKKLGIKFNYELVLLPGEVFKYHDKPIKLYFGKPIMPETLKQFKSSNEKTDYVRKQTYSLKPNNED
ncbi:MAG: 1-acyl-sn-glycerol-3-phosphate acyltransferase [Bacteroidales bacterium]|nr:1-acyl-sn-glycerol-3-phosphate acyltransferase [Bacteroidales bacterium]